MFTKNSQSILFSNLRIEAKAECCFPLTAAATDEDSLRAELYKRYRNQGPVYYGDADEADASLLEDDRAAEEKGLFLTLKHGQGYAR